MTDAGKARDLNEAARRFAETLADSYRLVYQQAAESGERQELRAREFSELVAVAYCVTRPERVSVNEILIRPTEQAY